MAAASDIFTCISHIRRKHFFTGKVCIFFYGSFHLVIAKSQTLGLVAKVPIQHNILTWMPASPASLSRHLLQGTTGLSWPLPFTLTSLAQRWGCPMPRCPSLCYPTFWFPCSFWGLLAAAPGSPVPHSLSLPPLSSHGSGSCPLWTLPDALSSDYVLPVSTINLFHRIQERSCPFLLYVLFFPIQLQKV